MPKLCERAYGRKPRAEFRSLNVQIVARLKIEPEHFGRSEELRKAKRGVCGDRAVALYDFVDAPRRNLRFLCKAILGNF